MSSFTQWGFWLEVLKTLLLMYGMIVVAVAFPATQRWLMFQPSLGGQYPEHTPADFGMAFEDLHLQAADGNLIHGWFVPAAEAEAPVVLFLHGNAGNIGLRLDHIQQLHRQGLAVLIIDYPGFGHSSGVPEETALNVSVRAAWDELMRRGYAKNKVVVYGRSMGGPLAAILASDVQPGGLMLESTFTRVTDLAARLYPWLPVGLLMHYQLDTAEALSRVHCPVLVMHSPDDEIVPYQYGRKLYQQLNSQGEWFELAGGHNDAPWQAQPAYLPTVQQFVANVTGGVREPH